MSAARRITKKEKRLIRQQKRGNNSEQVNTNVNFNSSLLEVQPLTKNQEKVFDAFEDEKHIVMHGLAGTGKSFLALYLSIDEVISGESDFKKVYVIRSTVPTRDQGFMPGSLKDKEKVYQGPYESICTKLFGRGDAYSILKTKNYLEFISTSFIRGDTFEDCIIILDEMQNCSFHELDTVITRVGENCKIIFCGDYRQSDLQKEQERKGLVDFLKILKKMDCFEYVEFGEEDIVRSKFVKNYIIQKNRLGLT